ncbi:hypothetical protein R3P38DRAFT_2850469 [Favolaschia claudopus]|uniref:Uncharacterized protein n=1 Tax=Favolaschia claudopus TaxID=2862362 RepID=A0AAW0DX50_9AGAR
MKNATRRFRWPFWRLTVMEPSKDRPESVSRRLRSKRLRSKSEPQRYATLRERARAFVDVKFWQISLDAVDTEVASAIVDVSEPRMTFAVPQPSICEEVKIHAELPAPEDLQPSIYDVNVVDGKYEPWSHPGGYTVTIHAPAPQPLSQIAIPEANILIPLPANYLLYPYPSVTFPNLLPRLIVRILPGPPQPKYLLPRPRRRDEEDFYEVRYYDSEDEHVEWAMSRVGPIRAGYPGASYIYYGV